MFIRNNQKTIFLHLQRINNNPMTLIHPHVIITTTTTTTGKEETNEVIVVIEVDIIDTIAATATWNIIKKTVEIRTNRSNKPLHQNDLNNPTRIIIIIIMDLLLRKDQHQT